jgi:glycosyltransferase involved in cell wall biosynthesis
MPMRVTHITIIHKPLDPRIFRKQCRALAAAGYEVHLVAGGTVARELDGVRLHSIGDSDARPRGSEELPRLIRAARVAVRLRPSVFHLHDAHLIPLGVALKLCGERVVYDVHEDYPAHARTKHGGQPVRAALKVLTWTALERVARATLDAFVCASPTLAAKFPPDRTVVVENLPLHREFATSSGGSARPYRERRNTVIYAGAISTVRGFREIARAVELLPAELDFTVRVIGLFRDRRLEHAVSNGSLPSRLELVPYQRYEVVIDELLGARVGLALLHPLPNHVDAARSNKLFEYMAAGVPVIASDLPRWRELVGAVGCGLLVDPRDPAAIAHAIEYLLTHPAEAEAMGDRGRVAVSSGLNWDAAGARLLTLYRRLTSASALPSAL